MVRVYGNSLVIEPSFDVHVDIQDYTDLLAIATHVGTISITKTFSDCVKIDRTK